MKIDFQSRGGSERGAYLLIIATIFLGVLFGAVMILGVQNARLKTNDQRLSSVNEVICSSIAQGTGVYMQKKATQAFLDQVTAAVTGPALEGITLLGAHLIVPTMPADGSFQFYNPGHPTPATFFGGPVPFLAAMGTNCPLGCAGYPGCEDDCMLFGTTSGLSGYPSGIWNDLQSAGNTVGCELIGVVNGKRVVAKTVWGQALKGDFSSLPAYSSTDPAGTSRSLIIAVAPHMTTDIADQRFDFNIPATSTTYSNEDRSALDPILDFDSPQGINGFTLNGHDLTYSLNPTLKVPEPQIDWSARPHDERRQLLTACTNPAIVMRNSFLGTLMEYLSRSGSTRMNTEVLLVGTQDRNTAGGVGVGVDAYPARPTEPVRLVDLDNNNNTHDLRARRYQLPYVVYHSVAPAPTFTNDTIDGWTNPLLSTSATPSASDFERGYISSQLRYCYHLYHHDNDTGLELNQTDEINNSGFEPAPPYDFQVRIRPEAYGPAALRTNWEQLCPWGSAGCNPDEGTSTRPLNAIELVRALGSIQRCPSAVANNCIKPALNPGTVSGAGSATQDLRPDIVGLMRYVGGLGRAVQSPGLFQSAPIGQPYPMGTGAGADFYRPVQNTHAALLLVTHRRLSQGEKQALINLQAASPAVFLRPITIIYIPTTLADADPSALQDFMDAFQLTDPITHLPISGSHPDPIQLNPYLPEYAGIFGGPTPTEATIFRDYWRYKIVDFDDNIDQSATGVLLDFIMKSEPIL